MRDLLIAVLIFAVIAPLALSVGSANENATIFKGAPSYILQFLTMNNHFKPGDNITLGLFIAGAGEVNVSKLDVTLPPYIVQNNTLVVKYLSFESDGTISATSFKAQNDFGFVLYPPLMYFKPRYNDSLVNIGENLYSGNPPMNTPILINFTISSKSPPGDQIIYLNLFYKDNSGKWYIDKQLVPIHINYWYEDDRLQYIAELAVIITLIGGVIVIIRGFRDLFLWRRRSNP